MRVGKSALSNGEKERGAEELRTRVCVPALSLFSQVPVPHVIVDGAYATDRQHHMAFGKPSRYGCHRPFRPEPTVRKSVLCGSLGT